MSNDIEQRWLAAGGKFFGPNIETGSMPKEKLIPFLEGLAQPPVPNWVRQAYIRLGDVRDSMPDVSVLAVQNFLARAAEQLEQGDEDE